MIGMRGMKEMKTQENWVRHVSKDWYAHGWHLDEILMTLGYGMTGLVDGQVMTGPPNACAVLLRKLLFFASAVPSSTSNVEADKTQGQTMGMSRPSWSY